jgi:hypothetical protein
LNCVTRELEHRFLLDPGATGRVLGAIAGRLEESIYDPARPVAWSRTTYLDTPDERYLAASQNGCRLRVRLRQYAAAPDEREPPRLVPGTWLEVKRSAGLQRHKVRARLSDEETAAVLCGGLIPQVTTWYRRRSWSGAGLRLTVDTEVAFCRPALPGAAGELAEPAGLLGLEPRSVLEIKSAAALPGWLLELLVGLPEAGGYSKLRAAVRARDGEGDPGAAVRQVLGPGAAAVRDRDPAHQAEPEAERAVPALPAAVEGLECAGQVLGGEAGAAVVDLEHHRRVAGADPEPHGPAGVALGVVEQVGQRAGQERRITRQ